MRRALEAAIGGQALALDHGGDGPGAPSQARRFKRLLGDAELLERFRGRTEVPLQEVGDGPAWHSYRAHTQFDDRGLLSEATRRLLGRYGHFTLHLLEEPEALPELLAREHADPEPDRDGNYWARLEDDPRDAATWIALKPYGNLVCAAELPDRKPDDTTWWEVNDLTQRLTTP